MDLFKAITGKNPAEYEKAAQIIVEKPDIDLFKKLVKQDDFLFDFIKNNVSARIKKACTIDNYLNLMDFLDYYSSSYENTIAEVLYHFGANELIPEMKEFFINGNNSKKAYAAKFLSLVPNEFLFDILPQIRITATSDYEPLSTNSIELLAKLDDNESKNRAIEKLKSEDEFEQYNAVKFLVTFGAKDALIEIIDVMKKSSLSENIAAEIPYLISIEDLMKKDFDNGILVLCNIVNSIPEILPLSIVIDYNLFEIFETLYYDNLTSSSAILLRLAQDKFGSISENEEYMFDCDKNTKEEILSINSFLAKINPQKLTSLLYDELFEESDFVFFAVDYVDDKEVLESLLDVSNQTLLLKVLSILKDKKMLNQEHKELALKNITNQELRKIVEVL